jgi:hypothetical protein
LRQLLKSQGAVQVDPRLKKGILIHRLNQRVQYTTGAISFIKQKPLLAFSPLKGDRLAGFVFLDAASTVMASLWQRYQKKYSYAADITWEMVTHALKDLTGKV